MHLRTAATLVTLASLAALACGKSSATHPALSPAPSPLPTGVESCAIIDDVQGSQRCQLYDTRAHAFLGATAPDPLLHRVLLHERWMDKWAVVEHQLGVRVLTEAMAPGDPESRFSDEQYLSGIGALGDSASYAEELGISTAHRCATTGTPADCQRMEDYIRGSVLQFEVTGYDGYLARYHRASVPDGTPMKNGYAMDTYGPDPAHGTFDILPELLPKMPAYYRDGIDTSAGYVAVKPVWDGHPSIDSYVGPMNAYPIAFNLVKDADLKARMAKQYGCFLKRLRIMKIIHLSQNAALQADIANYLNQGLVHLEGDDPDLTKIDEIWGFYLPQLNAANMADTSRTCPATLATDAVDPADVVDVAADGFEGGLLDLFDRQATSDTARSIDFVYFASLRSGDASLLLSHATAAYMMTGESAYLTWRDQVVDKAANGRNVARSEGAFIPPKACRSYYRTPGIYSAVFGRLLIEGDDNERAYWAHIFRDKLGGRDLLNVGDHLFAMMGAAALGERGGAVDVGVSELGAFGGTPDHLDDPRRNYYVDATQTLPAGIHIAPPPAGDVQVCQQGITLLGLHIPGDTVDQSIEYADAPLPLELRPPDSWMWGRDPYQASPRVSPGDAGKRQYTGIDLTEPYWIARHAGVIPDPHQVLAWGPQPQ